MAQLRLIAYDRGETDHLVEALGPKRYHSFLDCTAGLGSDSLVVAYAKRSCKKMVALEGNPLLAYITNYGLRHFVHENDTVTAALRRIQVCAVRFETFLQRAKDDSFDVVYFDPMFEVPVTESPQFFKLARPFSGKRFYRSNITRSETCSQRKSYCKRTTIQFDFSNYGA